MCDVLSIDDLDVDDNGLCTVTAYVDNVVVFHPQTYHDPAEYGAALCRGSFYISDDEVIPVDEKSQCEFVAERVLYWNVIDVSDWDDPG